MKGYFFILVLMVSSWTLSASSSLTSTQQSDKLFTELATELFQDGVIVIYQGLHDTRMEISDVGTAVGTLLDSESNVVWNDQFETPAELVFEHARYGEGSYEFILEEPDGTFIESVSFEIK